LTTTVSVSPVLLIFIIQQNDIPCEHLCVAEKQLTHFQGKWKGPVDIPAMSLEDSEENLEGKNKALFLQFMRKMLQWEPEKRKSARELLEDPWLMG
jgi:hypothetical protein